MLAGLFIPLPMVLQLLAQGVMIAETQADYCSLQVRGQGTGGCTLWAPVTTPVSRFLTPLHRCSSCATRSCSRALRGCTTA